MASSGVVRREFWGLVRAGHRPELAGVAVGVSARTGRRWMREAGGVPPAMVLCPPVVPSGSRGRRLTIEDREEIARGVAAQVSINEIARRIGFQPSSVMRELARNKGKRPNARYRAGFRPGRALIGRPGTTKYSPTSATRRAETMARRPKPSKLATNQRLRDQVQHMLEDKLSPDQISRRLVLDFPGDAEMRVSHETIYQALYVQGKGTLKRELTACLRTGRAIRRPHRRPDQRRAQTRITDIVSISQRPADIEDRAVPGHWEGDLITGTHNKSAIGTLVERTTGFVILLHLPGDHGALAVQNAMIRQMSRLPQTLLRTLTWDRGIEMANHAQIAAATGLDIYFCDPHSPWQRGTNENTNGLLRQYFPKGTDLSGYHPDYLDYVAAQLNNRPRKRHQYRTPAERLDQLLSHPQQPGIALTS